MACQNINPRCLAGVQIHTDSFTLLGTAVFGKVLPEV